MPLALGRFWDSSGWMIRAGFLSQVDRADLIALARDGSVEHRLARRANALVLLDAGWSFQKVAVIWRQLHLTRPVPARAGGLVSQLETGPTAQVDPRIG